MSDLEVRIVMLEPQRVASAYGFGPNPESIAFEKMEKYAAENDLLENGKLIGTFGFNNPDPSSGSPNYGYELWLPLEHEAAGQDDIEIKTVSGGLYAVTRLHGLEHIGEKWHELVQWLEESKYKYANHQWLEHLLSPSDTPLDQYIFDLYLPISE